MLTDYLLSEAHNFVIFFRSRAGSTTISRWYFENLGYDLRGRSISAFRDRWLNTQGEVLAATLEANYEQLLKVAVLRDPFDRLVSNYLQVVTNPNESQWLRYAQVTGDADKQALTFRQFVERFIRREDLDAPGNVLWGRFSAMPCWQRGVDVSIRLQDLNTCLRDINSRCGFEIEPGWNSVTVRPDSFAATEGFFGDSPYSELLRFRDGGSFEEFPHYTTFFDEPLRRSVNELYGDDIALFEGAHYRGLPSGKRLGRAHREDRVVFENEHYAVRAGPTSFGLRSLGGEELFDTPVLVSETCEVYNGRCQIGPGTDSVVLDRVSGLGYGEYVELHQYYAGERDPDRYVEVRIEEIDREANRVVFRPPLPRSSRMGAHGFVFLKLVSKAELLPRRVTVDEAGGLLHASYEDAFVRVQLELALDSASPEIRVSCRAHFIADARIHRLGFRFASGLAVSRLFLKNRQVLDFDRLGAVVDRESTGLERAKRGLRAALRLLPTGRMSLPAALAAAAIDRASARFRPAERGVADSDVPPAPSSVEAMAEASRFWLWREGFELSGDRAHLASMHSPRLAMVEIAGAEPAFSDASHPPARVVKSTGFRPGTEHGAVAPIHPAGKYAASRRRLSAHRIRVAFDTPEVLRGIAIGSVGPEYVPPKLSVVFFRRGLPVHHVDFVAADFRDPERSQFGSREGTALARFGESVEVDGYEVIGQPSARNGRLYLGRIFPLRVGVLEPRAFFWLEHVHAQAFRRFHSHHDGDDRDGAARVVHCFEDEGAPSFAPGVDEEYSFTLYASGARPLVPRLMLSPGGYLASHVWTEHADCAHLRTHRAVYFGHEDIDVPEKAVGGFVGHGQPVTKSIFFDNPHRVGFNSGRDAATYGSQVSYQQDAGFATLLDQLHALGHEVCLHLAHPDEVSVEEVAEALAVIGARYGSPTWIDHWMQHCHAALGYRGLVPGPFFVGDLLRVHGVRYLWHWASNDFQRYRADNLDLLHWGSGPGAPTPTYWRHPTVLGDDLVTWGATPSDLHHFNEESIAKLVGNWGISVCQHYFPYIGEGQDFGFYQTGADGKLCAQPGFDRVLKRLSDLRARGVLNITTVARLVGYWLALESVEVHLAADRVRMVNRSREAIAGFSFACATPLVASAGLAVESKRVGSDWLYWFDFAGDSAVEFRAS